MTVPAVGITLGDPGGIGPEVAVKALSRLDLLPKARFLVFGERVVWDRAWASLGSKPEGPPWAGGDIPGEPGVYFCPMGAGAGELTPGRPSAANGKASFQAFELAVTLASTPGALDGLVTAPISKTSWKMAGLRWRGHTEYLDSLYPGAIMTFWSERLKVALLSHHVPLKEAIGRVKREILLEFLRALHKDLSAVRSGVAEILVAGLNPHAGEESLLGGEEASEIGPAVEAAWAAGIPVSGPFPPDTVYRKALDRPERMVVALYHDQGLIAFKLAAFETGVNATLGLPFVRTSPDHGTAFDIAGRGIADARSMSEAIRLAVGLPLTR